MARYVESRDATDAEVEDEIARVGGRAIDLFVVQFLGRDPRERAVLADEIGWEPGEDQGLTCAAILAEKLVRLVAGDGGVAAALELLTGMAASVRSNNQPTPEVDPDE